MTKFLDFIRIYYPDLDESRLHPDYTGIRPKLYREGEPVPDFRIDTPAEHGLDGLVMLFGIESPGLTASLAIGDALPASTSGQSRGVSLAARPETGQPRRRISRRQRGVALAPMRADAILRCPVSSFCSRWRAYAPWRST